MIKAVGFCWIENKPVKRKIGKVSPDLKTVKSKAEARKILKEIF